MSCLRHLEKPIKTKENKVNIFCCFVFICFVFICFVFICFVFICFYWFCSVFLEGDSKLIMKLRWIPFCLVLLVVNSLQYYLQSLHLRSTGGLSLKWESHRNHEGITWDLRPPCSTCIGEILGDGSLPMQGDLEGLFLFPCDNVLCTSHSKDNERRLKACACFNLSSAKLRKSELAISL